MSKKLESLKPERLLFLLLRALENVESAPAPAQRKNAQTSAARLAQQLIKLPQLADFAPLGQISEQLQDRLGARSLTSLLVAVERALDRSLRDEDFLPARDTLDAPVQRMPLRLVADSLRSSFNVGGLFRSGECFAIEELVLCGYSADPGDARVRKAALGCDELLPWRRQRRIEDALEECKREGRLCLALESEAEHPALSELAIRWPCALFVGNERHGLTSGFLERADAVARIPLFGRKNSLNVVAATAIALAECRRAWGDLDSTAL